MDFLFEKWAFFDEYNMRDGTEMRGLDEVSICFDANYAVRFGNQIFGPLKTPNFCNSMAPFYKKFPMLTSLLIAGGCPMIWPI